MKKFIRGPSYQQMLYPHKKLPQDIWKLSQKVLGKDEFNPLNLYNIHWRDKNGKIRKIILPKNLTGVKANIIVLIGKDFPSGSHKVGPAYTTLIEAEINGELKPGQKTILAPSTGNFGIGTAYISKLKGYRCVVIMPDSMSQERYERIRKYGGELDLTPGTEADVILTLERTYELKKNPDTFTLAQFELLPNYRFHRYVTGNSCIEAAKDVGNGKIKCFVSAPGSAGTLGAGDEIKSVYPDCIVSAVEPRQCATLYANKRGSHRIEGIGDKMVTLIHNVLTTDFVVLVHDDDCVMGLKVIQDGTEVLKKKFGINNKIFKNLFGISSICNIIGAIKMAKYLNLSPNDNIVTIATDGFDRYPSVLVDLGKRTGRIDDHSIDDKIIERWARDIFLNQTADEILNLQTKKQKDRLFKQKQDLWTKFNYSKEYLDSMKKQDFWEKEYKKIFEIDKSLE